MQIWGKGASQQTRRLKSMANHIWVIETKMRYGWIPTLDFSVRDGRISGVHYTRKEARAAKQAMEGAKKYSGIQRRVRKYERAE